MPTVSKKTKTAKKETKAQVAVPAVSEKRLRRFEGVVVSAAMQKTVVVQINESKRHPKYHKTYQVSKKFHVHDEAGTAKVGDMVSFVECRPLSKTKRWRLVKAVGNKK